jgi:hypothetical protein
MDFLGGANDPMEVIRLSRFLLDQPAFQRIVANAVKDAGVILGGPSSRLASHMAFAYAQGYLQGWRRARTERADFAPPPEAGGIPRS